MELKVEKLIYGGDGLARLPADEHGRGKTVFIPFVLENERVEAVLSEQKRGFARARVNQILESSPSRIQAGCPYFSSCGGCHYQHSTYEHQLEIKASILKENLRRIAKLELPCDLVIHASPPWNYRNRTRMRVRTHPKFALGYFRSGSYDLLPVETCPISSPLINRAINMLWESGRSGRWDSRLGGIEFFADAGDEQLLVEAYCPGDTKPDAAQDLAATATEVLPLASGITVFPESTSRGEWGSEQKTLASIGLGDLKYKTAATSYRVSAGAFFQTNRYLIEKLGDIVTGGRTGRTALDLYAGVGLFSVLLSREFERVIAVESSLQSSADLAYNVSANVKTVRSTVEEYLTNVGGQMRADLIVVDPPRGGLGVRVAQGLTALKASRLTYVSCDPATLARDLVPLLASGYHVEQAHLVDLFPQTFHIESVFCLTR